MFLKKGILIVGVFLLLGGILILLGKDSSKEVKEQDLDLTLKSVVTTYEHNNKISIYYPVTDYQELNKVIEVKINEYVTSFKKTLEDYKVQPNQIYTLDISYESYEYLDYLSFYFKVSMYTGGAHPIPSIFTITYNKKNNSFMTISSLVKNNKGLLETLSSYSFQTLLKNNSVFQDKNVLSMLIEGTKPDLENFKHFVVTSDGFLFFFPPYQIAPYSSGGFMLLVPYDVLNIELD